MNSTVHILQPSALLSICKPLPSEGVIDKCMFTLLGNLDALCETWLMLLERLVNVKNIIDSPHMIMDKSSHLKNSETKPFDPVMFLLETHKVSQLCSIRLLVGCRQQNFASHSHNFQAALNTLKRLWSSDKLHSLSVRTCESVLTIICYLIHGEKSIKRKISKRQAPSGKCLFLKSLLHGLRRDTLILLFLLQSTLYPRPQILLL